MIDAAGYVGGAERIGRRSLGGRGRTKVKSQFPATVRWRTFVTAVLAATAMHAISSVAHAQAVAVLVDGQPVTTPTSLTQATARDRATDVVTITWTGLDGTQHSKSVEMGYGPAR